MGNCKTCEYFPCLKVQCNINGGEGCNDYLSIVAAEIKRIDQVEEKE